MKENLFGGSEWTNKFSGKEIRTMMAYVVWNLRDHRPDVVNLPITLEKIMQGIEDLLREDIHIFNNDFKVSEDGGFIFIV